MGVTGRRKVLTIQYLVFYRLLFLTMTTTAAAIISTETSTSVADNNITAFLAHDAVASAPTLILLILILLKLLL